MYSVPDDVPLILEIKKSFIGFFIGNIAFEIWVDMFSLGQRTGRPFLSLTAQFTYLFLRVICAKLFLGYSSLIASIQDSLPI